MPCLMLQKIQYDKFTRRNPDFKAYPVHSRTNDTIKRRQALLPTNLVVCLVDRLEGINYHHDTLEDHKLSTKDLPMIEKIERKKSGDQALAFNCDSTRESLTPSLYTRQQPKLPQRLPHRRASPLRCPTFDNARVPYRETTFHEVDSDNKFPYPFLDISQLNITYRYSGIKTPRYTIIFNTFLCTDRRPQGRHFQHAAHMQPVTRLGIALMIDVTCDPAQQY